MDIFDVSITGCAIDYRSNVPLQLTKRNSSTKGSLSVESFKSFYSLAEPLHYDWLSNDDISVVIDNLIFIGANRNNNASYKYAIRFSGPSSSSIGDLRINAVSCISSPYTTHYFIQGNDTLLRNTYINFAFQAPVNGTGESGVLSILDSSVVICAKTITSYYLWSGRSMLASEVELKPINFDGITINMSSNVKIRQKFSKVNTNSHHIKLVAPNNNNIIDGSLVLSSIELIDDGNGNKIVVSKNGDWS